MIALYRAELLSRWRMLAGLSVGVFAFLVVMGSTFKSLGLEMLGSAFSTHTPKAISAMSGTPGANLLTPEGWLGFGFAHPMFLLLCSTVAIALPAASIAGLVESGRAELLYVRPRTRLRLLSVSIGVWATGQVIVGLAALAGVLVGSLFDASIAGLGVGRMAEAVVQSATLFTFIASVAFLASSRTHTKSGASGIAIACTAAFYLLDFVSNIVDGLGWLRWCTPFGYYTPVATLTGGFSFGHAAVLLGAAAVLMAAAAFSLERRDLR